MKEDSLKVEFQDKDLDELFERSKDDRAIIVGSEVRQLIGEIRRQREHLGLFYRSLNPVWMTFAEREMIEEPIPPEAMLFTFMGSGASDNTTAGDFLAAWKFGNDE
jgi:hypothetical protein